VELKSGSSVLKRSATSLGDASDAIVATTLPVSTPTATPTPGIPAVPAPAPSIIQALLASPYFWLIAGAGALYLMSSGGSGVAIEGIEELGHDGAGDGEEDGEEDGEIVEEPPPKKAYRKPRKKSQRKSTGETPVAAIV
jgi:hypothetical protein